LKRIFLTGASSGIGRATAELLAARGYEIWGTSRDPERVPASSLIHPVSLDLRDPNSVRTAFQDSLQAAGHFDVVINNAGSGHFGPAESLSAEVIAEQFRILVSAPIELCQLALDSMRVHGSGLLINVTSLAARLPVPFMAAYNAGKAAMASFTMSLQLESPAGQIRIVDLQPADILTSFNDSVRRTPPVGGAERVATAWRVVEKNMKSAPGPQLVARRIARLIEQPNPPARVTVGDTFQATIAPFMIRFLPHKWLVWNLRQYYKL
jgi:NAD(P)-dependent dehydrogenase (short-subunit alcohol dehydrogenase family)